jgi:hypothetical protein
VASFYGKKHSRVNRSLCARQHTERAISRVLDDCLLTDDEMRKDKDAWVQMCADAGDPFYEDWYNAIESFAGNPENVHSHDHHHEHGHD